MPYDGRAKTTPRHARDPADCPDRPPLICPAVTPAWWPVAARSSQAFPRGATRQLPRRARARRPLRGSQYTRGAVAWRHHVIGRHHRPQLGGVRPCPRPFPRSLRSFLAMQPALHRPACRASFPHASVAVTPGLRLAASRPGSPPKTTRGALTRAPLRPSPTANSKPSKPHKNKAFTANAVNDCSPFSKAATDCRNAT